MIKVFAITKQTIFLERIGLFFKPEGIVIVGIAHSPAQGMRLLAAAKFDVILLDINWASQEPPIKLVDVISRIKLRVPGARIIAMSTFYSASIANEFEQLGFHGSFVRTAPDAAAGLFHCIKTVAAGKTCFASALNE